MEIMEIVSCSCCGCGLIPKDNIDHDKEPYPYDEGYGMCKECGGDPSISNNLALSNEEAFKKKMGWSYCAFMEARFEIIEKKLNPENLEKWNKSTYQKKCAIITGFIEKGLMI